MSGKAIAARVVKGILYGILILFLIALFLPIVFRSPFFLEIPFRVLFGWTIHAWKALPHLFGKWQEAVLPVGCLLMAAVIAHRFVRRWVDEKFPDRTWKIKHTAAVLSLLLLGSGAAIAASGVVHQMFWLGSEKMIESNRRTQTTVAVNNARQLTLYLFEYQVEKGRYPHSWEELEEFEELDMPRGLIWIEARDEKTPEPFVLLRPGAAELAPSEPLIVSPLLENGERVVVGFSDTSVKTIRADRLMEVIGKGESKESEDGR